ncbi:MAG: hypothetical protein ACYC9P_11390, partial [Rudaea sp.]
MRYIHSGGREIPTASAINYDLNYLIYNNKKRNTQIHKTNNSSFHKTNEITEAATMHFSIQ